MNPLFKRRLTGLLLFLVLGVGTLSAQFEPAKLQLRFGYNLHNTYANRFNHLIDVFNNERYPLTISENLRPLDFAHGFTFGGRYEFTDGIFIEAIFKNKHQFMEARYVDPELYRKYLFRTNTLELGISYLLTEEKWFEHFVSGGIQVGSMGVFTDWEAESGYQGSRKMLNIDRSAVLGLSLAYEADFILHDYVRVYIRPNIQYALHSHIRNLNDFFNPVVREDGGVTYIAQEDEKYNDGALNGIGIEAGLIFRLSR